MKRNGPVVLYQPRDQRRAMPLGLLHLASALVDQPVVIVDGRLDLAPEARVAGLARDAVCLGVTVRTGLPIADALRISRAASAADPDLPIVWGGQHPTLFPGQCLDSGVVDACVMGPGEETLREMVSALRADRVPGSLAGLAWRRGEETVTSPLRPPLPAPESGRADYGLLDLDHHFRAAGVRRLEYCSSRRSWPDATPEDLPWTGLPAERVVAELSDLVQRHGLVDLVFRDEDFLEDPRRAEVIARGLLEAGVHVGWSASGRAATLARLAPEALRALAASGCARIRVSTPGETVLRGEEAETLLEAGRRLRAAGIAGRYVFTAGFPGRGVDALGEIQREVRALRRIDPHLETAIRLHPPYPDAEGAMPTGLAAPDRLEGWPELEGTSPWVPEPLRHAAERLHFFLGEAGRPPGRRLAKRLLRLVARARVRLGFYGLDLDRRAVEWAARVRTGRSRNVAGADD